MWSTYRMNYLTWVISQSLEELAWFWSLSSTLPLLSLWEKWLCCAKSSLLACEVLSHWAHAAERKPFQGCSQFISSLSHLSSYCRWYKVKSFLSQPRLWLKVAMGSSSSQGYIENKVRRTWEQSLSFFWKERVVLEVCVPFLCCSHCFRCLDWK